jgi:hypothetical protein
MSAVMVTGIIHGIISKPLIGFENENFLVKNSASKNPTAN